MSDETPKSAPPEEEAAPQASEGAAPSARSAPDVAKAAGGEPQGTPTRAAAPDGDLGAVEARAGEARDRFRELLTARRNSRIAKWIVVLIFLGVFGGWVYVFYSTMANFDTDQLEVEMQARAERIFPRVTEMLFDVVTEVRPAYAAAITRELEKSGPVIGDRIDTEVKILEGNVQRSLQQQMDQMLKRVADGQRELLKKSFPGLANDPKAIDRMMVTIQEGLQAWVSKELTTTLHEHVDALLDIKETLSAFRAGDPTQRVDAEQMLGVWLELVYERMGGDETLEVTPPKSPTPAPGRPVKRAKTGSSR